MKAFSKKLILISGTLATLALASCGQGPVDPATSSQEETSSSSGEEPGPGPQPETKAITILAPANGQSFDIGNGILHSYLTAETDAEAIEVLTANKEREIASGKVSLSWERDGSAYYEVYLSEDPEFSNPLVTRVSGLTPHLEVNNLIPQKTYYWKVSGTVSGDVSETRTFHTLGDSVRLIAAEGGHNIRDLGGWKTKTGEALNYGRLYRGALLNSFNGMGSLTEEGKRVFRDQLRIKTEIDLRTADVDDGFQKECYFDADANYVQAYIGQYTDILDLESWLSLKEATGGRATSSVAGFSTTSLKTIFSVLAKEESYPVYFHCNAGADRTGTLSFLLEALCGVSEADLVRDYEITTFSQFGPRYRAAISGDHFATDGVMQNDSNNFIAFGAMLSAFKCYYGENLQEAVTKYLVEEAGISVATIEAVKEQLISNYQVKEYKTLSEKQMIYAESAQKSIDLSEIECDSIESITCMGESLGNHPESLDFSSIADLDGEQEILVTVTKGEETVSYIVPVIIVTKEISTYQELKAAIDFSIGKNLDGYYVLKNDIDFGSADFGQGHVYAGNDYFDSRGSLGFRGTLDGQGHTIKGKSGYAGLFGNIGAGAVIKNVTIEDNNYEGREGTNVLGVSMTYATFENVKFALTGNGSTNVSSGVGWLTSYSAQRCIFKNVEFSMEGKKIGYLFGGYANWLGVAGTSFENCTLNAAQMAGLGLLAGKNSVVSPFDFNGLSGMLGAEEIQKNTITIGEVEGRLRIADAYAGASLKSIKMGGRAISGAELDDGSIYFPLNGNLSNADAGERVFVAELAFETGLEVELTIRAHVESSFKKDTLANTAVYSVGKQSTLSLDMGKYASSEIIDIRYGDLSFGKNPNAIVLPGELTGNKANHGEQQLIIHAIYQGQEYQITAPILIVTETITTFDRFKEVCGHYDSSYVIHGYYRLGNSIGETSDGFAWTYDDNCSSAASSSTDKGFRATIDGQGYSITGSSVNRTWGVCGYIGNGACFKNVTINDYGTIGTQETCLLARRIRGASFENVNFVLKGTGSSEVGNGKGWISSWDIADTNFTNVNFDATGKALGTLFGYQVLRNTCVFHNCVIKASELNAIMRHANNAIFTPDNVPGVTFIKG